MAEEIRDLIEKINQDGIRAAEEKAQIIETEAKQRADEILSQARLEAERMITSAKERIRLEDEREKTLLAQAGRDLLLSLRKEINSMLGSILVSDIQQALTPEELYQLISQAIRIYSTERSGEITISLATKDLELMENQFLQKLRQETKKSIVLRPAGEISGGFTISYDSGKSCYDYSDKALAEYIGEYLKPKLNRILKEAVRE